MQNKLLVDICALFKVAALQVILPVSAMVELIWFKSTEFNGLPRGSNLAGFQFPKLMEHSGFLRGTKTLLGPGR